MYDTILVPLDGGTPAETAIPYAMAEARVHQARLVLMHVVARPEPCGPSGRRGGPAPRNPDWCADQFETAITRAHDYLRDVIVRHALPATTTLHVTAGDPATHIRDEATQHPNCLLVMTTGDLAARQAELSRSLRSTSSIAQLSNVFQRLSAHGATPILSVNPTARPATARSAVESSSISPPSGTTPATRTTRASSPAAGERFPPVT
jgi:nucleotide-binding universal stress UspA family protein